MHRSQIVFAHAGLARLELIAARVNTCLRALSELFLKLHRAWVAARARRELLELPDRTLNDIGLSREQIDKLFR